MAEILHEPALSIVVEPAQEHRTGLNAAQTASSDAVNSLARRLRNETAEAHARIEACLGLPTSIRSRNHYAAWLAGTRGLLGPLHRTFARFEEWAGLGLDLAVRSPLHRLDADLAALGLDPLVLRQAPRSLLPVLLSFPQALGALYVVEGANLGARMILRDLRAALASDIDGATSFLEGYGTATGERWRDMRAALDLYGRRHPERCREVVAAANATFDAFARWVAPCIQRVT
jgi:heme oxygenase